jgi:protein TonB
MQAVAMSPFRRNEAEARGMNAAFLWSLVAHLVLVIALFVGSRMSEPPKPPFRISLGGTAGPRSTGMTEMGGRTVEQVAPPPRRPEPARPVPPKTDAPVVVKTPKPTPAPPKPSVTERPEPITTRPPVTGREVTKGATPVDTGASGQSSGLSFGGSDGTGGLTDLRDFCCPQYLTLMQNRIDAVWKKAQSQSGTNVVRFTVLRDGTITNIEMETPSGIGILDRASRSALIDARLPQLPPEYKGDTLTVHITFPYR